MKQVLQNMKSGELKIENVPEPTMRAGGILVRNYYSLISAGTERTSVETGKLNIIQKARSRPDDVKRVINDIKQIGFSAAYRKVMSKLNSFKPLGYSSAGIILAVDPLLTDFRVGDRVACAGAGYANHADIVFVPKNLAVKVPDEVKLEDAAYATVGAIALQGIRQAQPSLGENVVVIGLGLVGLLAVQILKANGCSVLGVDVDPDNLGLAKKLGADVVARRSDDIKQIVDSFTGGFGADVVIIAAATKSSDPLSLAGEIARDRSRVIMIGATGMTIPRSPYYLKELEFKLSRSYGPGRYDPSFEEKGNDYPIGYVRWTENRNMGEFLRLIEKGKVDVKSVTTHRFNINSGEQAYKMITGKTEKYIGIILEYGEEANRVTSIESVSPSKKSDGTIAESFKLHPMKVGFIGAGSFAQSSLLPAVKSVNGVSLTQVCTSAGATAKTAKDQFGFGEMTTDSNSILTDEKTGTVFIATRHNLHASLALSALKAGKNVFVEKPLALNEEELVSLGQFYRAHDEKELPLLLVGYNRRFSPLALSVRDFVLNSSEPVVVNCRVNAGFIPKSHWTQDPIEGGGRIVGEVCHFVDLVQFLTASRVTRVHAESVSSNNSASTDADNVVISLRMKNGSLGLITYLANGDTSLPKERIEVTSGRRAAVIDNFQYGFLHSNGNRKRIGTGKVDKGINSEVRNFMDAVSFRKAPLISFDDLVNSSLTTFKILTSLSVGGPVEL